MSTCVKYTIKNTSKLIPITISWRNCNGQPVTRTLRRNGSTTICALNNSVTSNFKTYAQITRTCTCTNAVITNISSFNYPYEYVDCNGVNRTVRLVGGQSISVCLCASCFTGNEPNPNFTISLQQRCISLLPVSPTPSITPTRTPAALSCSYGLTDDSGNWFYVDCCGNLITGITVNTQVCYNPNFANAGIFPIYSACTTTCVSPTPTPSSQTPTPTPTVTSTPTGTSVETPTPTPSETPSETPTPTPTPTPIETSTPTPTPIETSTPTPTPTSTPCECLEYKWNATQHDINIATGNTGSYNNNAVYLDYDLCEPGCAGPGSGNWRTGGSIMGTDVFTVTWCQPQTGYTNTPDGPYVYIDNVKTYTGLTSNWSATTTCCSGSTQIVTYGYIFKQSEGVPPGAPSYSGETVFYNNDLVTYDVDTLTGFSLNLIDLWDNNTNECNALPEISGLTQNGGQIYFSQFGNTAGFSGDSISFSEDLTGFSGSNLTLIQSAGTPFSASSSIDVWFIVNLPITPTPTPTPTITPTPTETPTNTPTETSAVTPTPTETPTNTPTPSVTPSPVTGYGFNLIVLPYNFPSSGNTIMTKQGTGQTGTTDPNVFISNANGIYFNSIDITSTDRTNYFSGFTGQSITITLTQNGDSAIYSGSTNAFQSWTGLTGAIPPGTPGTGFVFGTGISIVPSGLTGSTVLIQSATTQWVTGQTVYISAEINVPVTPTPTPTVTTTVTPTITDTPTPTPSSTPLYFEYLFASGNTSGVACGLPPVISVYSSSSLLAPGDTLWYDTALTEPANALFYSNGSNYYQMAGNTIAGGPIVCV